MRYFGQQKEKSDPDWYIFHCCYCVICAYATSIAVKNFGTEVYDKPEMPFNNMARAVINLYQSLQELKEKFPEVYSKGEFCDPDFTRTLGKNNG